MRIQVEITGTTPLIMHSDRLADTSDKITIAIKELTAKKTSKTTKDEETISKLEWHGSAYTDANGNVAIPSANIIRCLRDAAAITKKGKDIVRAVSPFALTMPLIINGQSPTKLDKLWGNPIYVDSRMVKIQRDRVKRTRPIFPKWGLAGTFELLDSVMNFTTLENIFEIAGLSTGLGDARILGYGRFACKITKTA